MKDISLVKILPMEPKVPFINLRVVAAIISMIAIVASIFLFTTKGLNYGIDFTGGTVIEIDTGSEPDLAKIRTVISDAGFPGASVQGLRLTHQVYSNMTPSVLVFHCSLRPKRQVHKPSKLR